MGKSFVKYGIIILISAISSLWLFYPLSSLLLQHKQNAQIDKPVVKNDSVSDEEAFTTFDANGQLTIQDIYAVGVDTDSVEVVDDKSCYGLNLKYFYEEYGGLINLGDTITLRHGAYDPYQRSCLEIEEEGYTGVQNGWFVEYVQGDKPPKSLRKATNREIRHFKGKLKKLGHLNKY